MAPTDAPLDWKSQAILVALDDAGGSATTTEVRKLTGLDNNDIVRYRFSEKLEKQGLIDTARGDTDGTRLAPTVATLTEQGQEQATRPDEERETAIDLSDEVEQLRADVTSLQTQLGESAGSPAAADVADLSKRVNLLWEGMTAMRNYLREEHDADLESYLPEENAEKHDPTP